VLISVLAQQPSASLPGPAQLARAPRPPPTALPAQAVFPSPRPASRHGPSPATGPTRVVFSFPLSLWLALRSHMSGAPSSFPRRRRIPLSLFTTDRICLPISPFLTRTAFGLYKQGCHTQPPPSNPFTASATLSRCHRELEALPHHHRPPLQAARLPWFIIGFVFARGEVALVFSTRWCFSFAR
jgi:hypothetical protein